MFVVGEEDQWPLLHCGQSQKQMADSCSLVLNSALGFISHSDFTNCYRSAISLQKEFHVEKQGC